MSELSAWEHKYDTLGCYKMLTEKSFVFAKNNKRVKPVKVTQGSFYSFTPKNVRIILM